MGTGVLGGNGGNVLRREGALVFVKVGCGVLVGRVGVIVGVSDGIGVEVVVAVAVLDAVGVGVLVGVSVGEVVEVAVGVAVGSKATVAARPKPPLTIMTRPIVRLTTNAWGSFMVCALPHPTRP
jgi:hypothetical protein